MVILECIYIIMNKIFSFITVLIAIVFSFEHATAQGDTLKKNPVYKIGIFAPLYLDSVFNDKGFKYRQGMPKFIMPALDFVQGAQVALDSMAPGNDNIEAWFYDSKSYTQTVSWLIQNNKLDSLNIIIGNVKDMEYRQLADFALQKKIPFISATLPNDGGITSNPYLMIVNSTLRSHCEAIYSYLLQNHGTDKLYLFRQKGSQEDMVANYFKQINERDGKPLLEIQTVNFDSVPNPGFIKKLLDSNRQSIIIGGSLEENFSTKLALACSFLHGIYPITLLGMPTWDGFASLNKKTGLENFPVYFTSPYYNSKTDGYSKILTNAYLKRYKGKPSDMAFKGFEMVHYFTALISKYPKDPFSHINDVTLKVFNDYNFKPVQLKKENAVTDYYENKHLYFIKILNGIVSRAW